MNELLAHHDLRLAEIRQAVMAGHATPFEVAKAIKWTRRQRLFSELDVFSQIMSVNETAAHLEVLLVRGQVGREISRRAPTSTRYPRASRTPRPRRPR